MKLVILSIFTLSFINSAFSAVYELKNAKIEITSPKNWRAERDLLGLPLSLLGPSKNGARPVISISSTPFEKIKFDKDFSKSFEGYKNGRLEFLKKHKGELLSFIPYEKLKWNKIKESHTYGFEYKVSGISYSERSYYINCKDKLFHIKSMDRLETKVENLETIKKIIRSFKCF